MASRQVVRSALSPALALAFAIAVAGCDDSVSPYAVADIYVLTATGTAAFPVPVVDNEFVTVSILADTFRLRADGTGSHTRSQRVVQHGDQPDETTQAWTREFSWEPREDGLEVSYPCQAFAAESALISFLSCVAPPHETGRWVSGGFVLESLPADFVYLRVSGPGPMASSGS